jgi:hypothetical protein
MMLFRMRNLVPGLFAVASVTLGIFGSLAACGSSNGETSKFDGGSDASLTNGDDDDDGGGGDAARFPIGSNDGGIGCTGLQCAITTTCDDAGGTTITGTVLDPAGANPIYNALVFVPEYDPAQTGGVPANAAIQPITGGVSFPAGVSCDNCGYLYTGNPVAAANTGPDGTFTITNVPSGPNIPLVVQIGKWRTHVTLPSVQSCANTAAGSIKLPSKTDAADPIISMPEFALSMGNSDSLECLLYRIGVDTSEFVSGPSTTGHVHLFAGAGMSNVDTSPNATQLPEGDNALWDSLADMQKYDVSLFSCEGRETTNANPQVLEQYVNSGGRAFVSHYHYSWLSGPINTNPMEGPYGNAPFYTANADWKSSLATWNNADEGVISPPYYSGTDLVGVKISTTLNQDGGVFPKGEAMTSWLTTTKAFGPSGSLNVPADEVPILAPAFDSQVAATDTDSQPWATYDSASYVTGEDGTPGNIDALKSHTTAYFSFNTPVDAASTDGGAAPYCGRVVFSGLHVGAAAKDTTTSPTSTMYNLPSATTCNPTPGNLSPQEKILEFMIFDLSSCVVSDNVAPPSPITVVR